MGSICDLLIRFVICGYGFVLWCATGLFCGAVGGFFFGSGIYYFIVVVILFYCSGYIILL